jgi:L-cysteine S-thiosulfotransferase
MVMKAASFPIGLALCFALAMPQAFSQPSGTARQDGSAYMSEDLKRMQRDDSQNPGMLWVAMGRSQWQQTPSLGVKSCAECHQAGLKGVAARYPTVVQSKFVTLSDRINQCRIDQQQQKPFAFESEALLGLETYVAHQSRGLAIQPAELTSQPELAEKAKALYEQRIGQLNLSCKDCHDGLAGKRLSGSLIPQAHPTNYPTYRIEWQTQGSLQRRFRNCMTGVRAEPYAYGSQEFAQLEWYLKNRAVGIKLDAPGVRP